MYELQRGRLVNGHPAWKSNGQCGGCGEIHEEKLNKWITRTTAGNWIAQPEADLGTKTGLMVLRDTTCADPTESTVPWEWTNTDGGCGEWIADSGLVCRAFAGTAADLAEKNEEVTANRRMTSRKMQEKQRRADAGCPL